MVHFVSYVDGGKVLVEPIPDKDYENATNKDTRLVGDFLRRMQSGEFLPDKYSVAIGQRAGIDPGRVFSLYRIVEQLKVVGWESSEECFRSNDESDLGFAIINISGTDNAGNYVYAYAVVTSGYDGDFYYFTKYGKLCTYEDTLRGVFDFLQGKLNDLGVEDGNNLVSYMKFTKDMLERVREQVEALRA